MYLISEHHYSEPLSLIPLSILYHKYCVVVTCPDLNLANGQINYSPLWENNQRPVDSVTSFSCDDGYRLNGSDTTTCQTSGT